MARRSMEMKELVRCMLEDQAKPAMGETVIFGRKWLQ
jgi:hypothetical protein